MRASFLACVCALQCVAASSSARPALFFIERAPVSFESVLEARRHAASTGLVLPRAHSPGRISIVGGEHESHSPASGVLSVTLEWSVPSAVRDGRGGDAITVHCANASGGDADFGDFYLVPQTASSGGEIRGATRVRLLAHTSCALEFRYLLGGAAFVGGPSTAAGDVAAVVVAAVSSPVRVGSATDAVGTRLSYGDGAGEIQLTWTSMDGAASARVRVGTSPGGPYPLVFSAASAPVTYKAADLCHAPANATGITSYLDPGFFHTVLLSLNASTRYVAVYGQEGGAEAPETTFMTRAAPGPDVAVKFAVFADSAT